MTDALPNSPYLNKEAMPEAHYRARRYQPITARQVDVLWTWPGSDSALRLDVDFDQFGVPRINDVLDAAGKSFPLDQVWFNGKPLVDVLIDYLTGTPECEWRRA